MAVKVEGLQRQDLKNISTETVGPDKFGILLASTSENCAAGSLEFTAIPLLSFFLRGQWYN